MTILAALVIGQQLGHLIEYKIGNETFEGYGAKAAGAKEDSPIVYVIQDWDGVNEHEKQVVEKLAKAGYSAFAIDIYGKDNRPTDTAGNQAQTKKYYADPNLYMSRITEGMKVFPTVGKKFAIGYCFGGAGVLEFARRNLGADGVVAFHGGLKPLAQEKVEKVNADVLVLNGADDPSSPPAVRDALTEEMKVAASFKQINYPGAVHAFTVKAAGPRYNEQADKMSWVEMMAFLRSHS